MTIFSRTQDETDEEFVKQVLIDLVNLADASLTTLKAKHKQYSTSATDDVIAVAETLSDQVLELTGIVSVLLSDITQLEHSLASLSRRNDKLIDDLDAVHDWSYDAALDAATDELAQVVCDSGHGTMSAAGDTLTVDAPKTALKSIVRRVVAKWITEKLK